MNNYSNHSNGIGIVSEALVDLDISFILITEALTVETG